jgi:tRNA (guanosine-2'-O-)-methyltransferase
MPTLKRIERMRFALKNRQPDLTVVCENIHDPHNVSAILRSCDSVGVQRVYLLYNNEGFPKLGKKSSASAKKWIEIIKVTNEIELREKLKSEGITIYATHLDRKASSIYTIDWIQPSAIIVGNENRGVSDKALKIADKNVYIPMFGMIKSLNVSVATAVILYESARQRIKKGMYPNDLLTEDWIEHRLKLWKEK